MPFYAHRSDGRYYLLSAHLAGVAVGAAARIAESLEKQQVGRTVTFQAALAGGLAHDFGKYTGYFQKYLRTGRGGAEKQHALLSGLWAAYLAQRLGMPSEWQLILFLAVARHHQDLADPEEYLVPRRDIRGDWAELEPGVRDRLRVTAAQVDDLRSQAQRVAASLKIAGRRAADLLLLGGLPACAWLQDDWSQILTGFLEGWKDSYAALYSIWRERRRNMSEIDLSLYFNLLTSFSAVIDADKVHAARVADAGRMHIPWDAVQRYRAARQYGGPGTRVDALREDLYRWVMERVRAAPVEQRLFTLTAPTGAGKTLSGLAAAFCLRQRLAEKRGIPPRIIYALPFTSIVDQTFAVGEEVLRAALPKTEGHIPTSWILKHHHLADLVYREPGREEERPLDEALLLIESWQSEFVVTTFVQFFCTLIGYENRMLKKFSRLRGAVVILDEVQNIPVEYWPLVEETLRQACRHLDLSIILMTATRPEWFRPGEALELAGDPETVQRQFGALNRVRLTADTTPRTVHQAAAAFLDQYDGKVSYLVVLNTIKSSIAFYNMLRDAWSGRGPSLYYLSTNIVPADRERRLAEIRERLTRGEKPVVVSTQVVEAGVDLDFDEVWRDLGPVDAIVQVAGRCNRHSCKGQGSVKMLHLVNEEDKGGRSLASYVYGKIHAVTAQRLFTSRPCLEEPDFFEAVADYFQTIRQNKSSAEGRAVLEAMAALRFDKKGTGEGPTGVSDFALVRGLPGNIDVFVCTDDRAEVIWTQYQNTVVQERDLRRRWAAFLELKRDFRRYLLSVPAESLLHRLSGSSGLPVIPGYLLDEFYDEETGFRRIDEQTLIF